MTHSQTEQKNRAGHNMPLLPILGLVYLVLPHLAWAEGAVRIVECNITQICDSAGACEAESDEVTFRLAPENLREDGAGEYEISYRNIQAGMEATSEAGPFYWTTGSERNTLLASSETHFLWHRLSLEPTPAATVHFLQCTLK